jgi:hypothetical protein
MLAVTVDAVSHHHFGTQNFKVLPGFLRNMCYPYINGGEMFVSEGMNIAN